MKYLEIIAGAMLFFMSWLVYFDELATLGGWVPLVFMTAGAVVVWDGFKHLWKRGCQNG